jgi:monoamine oxidase
MGQGGEVIRRRSVLAAGAVPALWLSGCGERPPAIEGGFNGINVDRGHVLREARARLAPAIARRVHTVIAGGGVAGLAAARALRQRGQDDFALLELEDTPGGNSRGTMAGGLPCPMGAHYLPVPGDDSHEVQDLLEELGLRQRLAGRWTYDERHLCHSPQERLYFNGEWQEGLLPVHGVSATTLAQYRRFATCVEAASRQSRFSIPAFRASVSTAQATLAAQTFARWLDAEGLDDAQLRWYLDYCCRDDYGAGIATVSAWAGLHYFASRHGFSAPVATDSSATLAPGESGVLTWPEGNGWLTQRLAAPLGQRARLARTVLRIAATKHGVEVDAFDHHTQQLERWQAAHCIVALPLFIAARVVENAPAFLKDADAYTPHAAWLVANVHIREPLRDHPGAPPSWDNVVYGSRGLGYVDARHQSTDPRPGATVLTWYHALGETPAARRDLLTRSWTSWRDTLLGELSVPHPDLAAKTTRIDITRYGHAMAVPVPRARTNALPPVPQHGRLLFAHGDWAGYSIFEEAFTRGHLAGAAVAEASRQGTVTPRS